MNADRSALRRFSRHLFAVLLLAVVGACGGGGGVDTGGTGAAMTSLATGRIEGFGSIVVNGVHYDDANAAILDDDGVPHGANELRLGMTVQVEAGPIVRDSSGTPASAARQIRFGSEIVGPVDSVTAASGTLRVLGQAVRADVNTVLADMAGLASLRAGDVVQVFAFFDPTSGTYTATRIERAAAATAYKVRGPIAQLDVVAKTFAVGGAAIAYGSIGAADVPGLQNGALARVDLRTQPQAGRWVATRILTGLSGIADETAADTVLEIEGFVTDFVSIASFKVDGGVRVDASGPGVDFEDGTAAQLGNGARIEVKGRVRDGVLVAERLEILRAPPGSQGTESPPEKAKQFELKGEIESVNLAARSFVVRGTSIVFDASTDFDKGGAADLKSGVTVQAKGTLVPGGSQVHADRIKFFK